MQNDGFLFLFFSSIIRDHMSNKMYYVTGPIVDIFHGTAFVAMRSILSKLVPANELGKLLLQDARTVRSRKNPNEKGEKGRSDR